MTLEEHFSEYLDAWESYDQKDDKAAKLKARIDKKRLARRKNFELRPATLREVFASEKH